MSMIPKVGDFVKFSKEFCEHYDYPEKVNNKYEVIKLQKGCCGINYWVWITEPDSTACSWFYLNAAGRHVASKLIVFEPWEPIAATVTLTRPQLKQRNNEPGVIHCVKCKCSLKQVTLLSGTTNYCPICEP